MTDAFIPEFLPVVTTADSYRERIMQTAQRKLKAVVAGQPVGDPRTIQWSVVERRPLRDQDRGKANALSVLDTNETKTERLEQKECLLQVVLEWYCPCPADVDFATHNNRVLTELQLTVFDQDTWTDEEGEYLVIQVTDRGNTLDVDSYIPGPNNRRVEGTLFLNVLYRHSQHDPRRYV